MMMLAAATFWKLFTAVLFVLTCVLLIVVVLLQRGRGGGLSGAFGGAGGYSPFGAKTGDFFTWLTVGLAGVFLILAISSSFVFRKVSAPTPATPPAQMPAGGAPPAPMGGPGGETPPADVAPGGAQPAGAPANPPVTPAEGGSK